jgi:two-component system nitrogen regulation sensor histidine kinase GlnL
MTKTAAFSNADILNSLSVAVLLLDSDLNVLAVNRAAEEDLPHAGGILKGRPLIVTFPWLTPYRSTLLSSSGAGRSCYLSNIPMPEGPAWAHMTPHVTADGAVEGSVLAVGISRGSSDERDDLAFESVEGLISQIAHEIRNPLGGIRGASQLLAERLPPDQGEFVHVIIREVDRLSAMLRELLDFAAPARAPRHTLNIHEVIDRAFMILAPEMDGITVRRLYDPSLPDVCGDGAKLLQVFINLIRNAAEAMRSDADQPRIIEVQTRPSSRYMQRNGRISKWAEVRVIDNGPGIAREDLRRIFLPYYTRKKQGSGLGLAISKKILVSHEGMLRVESREGMGATFIACVPFAASPSAGRQKARGRKTNG